jgi:starch-binding outer membrane protein, SusD/RagB family
MKKLIYRTFLFFVILLSSCNEILDIEPSDRITGIWESADLVEAYVNGSYLSLEHGFCFDMWGCLTDELHAVHDAGTWEVQRGDLTADNIETTGRGNVRPTFNKWILAYRQIRNNVEFFENIDEATFDENLKKRMKGEIKFINAYLYAELIWRYGDVPIINEIFELGDDYTKIKRESYDDVVDFILSQLDEAIALLPSASESDKGRANQDAAKALKSRVLLYAASPLNNPNNDLNKWQKAADAAKVLIDKNYSLHDDYRNLFLEETNEIIFARYFTPSNAHRIAGWSGISGYTGGGSNAPTQNIVMDYEMINGELPYSLDEDNNMIINLASGYDPSKPYMNREPRFYASIIHDGEMWKGREVEKFIGGIDSPQSDAFAWNSSLTGYALKKFVDPEVPSDLRNDDMSTNPWIYFRYGEILLNYAEAKFELGDENTARDYINKIRARVDMPLITATGDELRDKIRHERRIELAFEGHRFFDVRRWKILDEVSNNNILGMEITKNPDESKSYKIITVLKSNYHERLLRLPIPQSEIDKSSGALSQNTGY